MVHSETGFEWQGGDGQWATSAHCLPGWINNWKDGKANPCVPLGDREAASPERQRVVLSSLPDILQAVRKGPALLAQKSWKHLSELAHCQSQKGSF